MFLYDGLVSKHVSCVSMCACVLLFCVRAANLYISCLFRVSVRFVIFVFVSSPEEEPVGDGLTHHKSRDKVLNKIR